MDKTCARSWGALLAGGLVVALPALLLRFALVEPSPEERDQVASLLNQLKAVCVDGAPLNDYFASTTAQPTERLREEILNSLAEVQAPALSEIRTQLQRPQRDEYGEMLQLAAMHLGDASAEPEVAELMVYSDHPAVRILAARLLRKTKPTFARDYFLQALKDTRFVSNDGCASEPEKYYPVRTIAVLALRDMGVEAQPVDESRQPE